MPEVYNFSAGPSVLPREALLEARKELLSYHGSGLSIMELSHRSPLFQEIIDDARDKLRLALSIPETHEILFMQGGGYMQFAAAPMNLMHGAADYALTGHFSAVAAREAGKYGSVRIAFSSAGSDYNRVPKQNELRFSPGASYFYYCDNNTAFGTEWPYVPEAPTPLVCDMSSNILSRPVEWSRYGLVFAGAQKNMAPAGLTVVVVRRDLLGQEAPYTPSMLSYRIMAENGSMPNTPPCWCIYMLSLTLDWLLKEGGVEEMQRRSRERSAIIYEVLDNSKIYLAPAQKDSRSDMNIRFGTVSPELDKRFIQRAAERGLYNLKGHRAARGLRASLYNAMPLEGAKALASFMKDFEHDEF